MSEQTVMTAPKAHTYTTMRARSSLAARLTALNALGFAVAAAAMTGVVVFLVRSTYSEESTRQRALQVADELGFDPGGEGARALARVIGVEPGELLTQVAADARNDALRQMLVPTIVGLTVTVVGFTAMAWWIAHRALRPLRDMAASARQITADEPSSQRLTPTDGPDDEVRQLGEAFDGAFQRIESVLVAQRSFATHAAHELRTPLAVLRAEAELEIAAGGTSRLAQTALGTVDRCDRLISSLLTLARLDATDASSFTATVRLAELTGDVAGEIASLADRHGVELALELDEVSITGDQGLVRSLIANLLSNAIVHNVAGGQVTVSVTADRRLIVSNTGTVMSAETLARLGQPFERLHPDRPGLGLGLVVIDAIADRHGAVVTRSARSGGGLTTVVQFGR